MEYEVHFRFDRTDLPKLADQTDKSVFYNWLVQVFIDAHPQGATPERHRRIRRILETIKSSAEHFVVLEAKDLRFVRDCFHGLRYPVDVNSVWCQFMEKFDGAGD